MAPDNPSTVECSIAAFAVDRVRWPPAGSYRVGGCNQRGRDGLDADFAGVVGCDDDFGVAPERMFRRQRFGCEHVECGAIELTVVERCEQIMIDEVLAYRAASATSIWYALSPGLRLRDLEEARSVVHDLADAIKPACASIA